MTAGSHRYGFGHVRRSMELAKTLEETLDVALYAYIESRGQEGIDFSEVKQIKQPFVQEPCHGILIDMPKPYVEKSLDFYSQKMSNIPLIALGCFSKINDKPDVVINLDNMGENPSYRKYYEGLQYGIIREGFFKYCGRTRISKGYYNVVISLGGADVGGLSGSLVQLFHRNLGSHQDIKYHLILGPLSEKKEYQKGSLDLSVHYAPKNVEELMSAADVAICNGGTMMMEYAFLGIPVIAVPQTLHEEIFIRKFEQQGAAVMVKSKDIHEKLSTILLDLLSSQTRRESMRRKGQKMSDGLGKNRIAQIIKEVI